LPIAPLGMPSLKGRTKEPAVGDVADCVARIVGVAGEGEIAFHFVGDHVAGDPPAEVNIVGKVRSALVAETKTRAPGRPIAGNRNCRRRASRS
jgi:hypothetical protein